MAYYRRTFRRRYRYSQAAQHVSERRALSQTFAGIDKDVEKIFLNLTGYRLESIFLRYGKSFGKNAESYAREALPRWKSGQTKMSGEVAERLLNLVPMSLDAGTRFELVRKLRNANFQKIDRFITTAPQTWRSDVGPVIEELVKRSSEFALSEEWQSRLFWTRAT